MHKISKLIKVSVFSISVLPFGISGFGDITLFNPRSQTVNAVRDLVGWQRDINVYDVYEWYWTDALTLQYAHSFRSHEIACVLFGSNKLVFSGSRVADRNDTDILADYFGLPADFQSTVCFKPRICNTIFDIAGYIGLDRVFEGFYIRYHLPLVYTRWGLGMQETIQDEGTFFHPAGYMGPERIDRDQLADSVKQAWCNPITFGDMQDPMRFGKVCPGTCKEVHFSDAELAFGWNFCQSAWYHLGLNARFTLPFSKRPNPKILFAPQIGNRHHVGAGIGLTSHVDMWESCDSRRRCALYFDANIVHLFDSWQVRSFDLYQNGPGSRYMLLEQITDPAVGLAINNAGTFFPAPNQYDQVLLPAINVTTLCSKIGIGVEGDLVLKFSYFHGGWGFDLGYDFWARSGEKLAFRDTLPSDTYAVKGDAQVYGFDDDNAPLPINATQSKATIHGGNNGTSNVATVPVPVPALENRFRNTNADNPMPAALTDLTDLNQLNASDAAALGISQQPINTSNIALLISDEDIDDCSALSPQLMSHTLFTHIEYRWDDCKRGIPCLGVGADAEWAGSCCGAHSGLSQWSVWLKGSLLY